MRKGEMLINLLKNRSGSTSVIFLCSAVIIILLSAIATDIGYIAIERYKMDRVLDQIAKIGATALIVDKNECTKVIKENAVKRIDNITKLEINVSDNNREMSINIERKLDYIFLKYIGFKDKNINSRVTAKVSNVTSFKGIRPFAIPKTEINYGKQYYLSTKESKFLENNDNGGFIRLITLNIGDGNFETAILYGLNKTVNTGKSIYALDQSDFSRGNESIDRLIKKCDREPSCTYENYEVDCSRIIVLPVVDKAEASGKKAMVILGFTAFFIENVSVDKEKNKESIELKGRFIKYTVNSSTSDGIPDFGLLGVKLKHW
ncbi:TadE/TadG family type IV pilus assembly protein [Acetivibrio cellulolyticus]|uniref:TadE/TadG family type IV pilus assembly protein n=1 Tax=Acetivibrio cellulolyticus TaxID=35830 RepID=UPI0001E2F61B|nr:hypothetical protein [Acetivibrio cellulolyticus]